MDIFQDSTQKRRVAIYKRVSTTEQKIDGYSLESQDKKLKAYVRDNKGLNFTTRSEWCFEDVHTGGDLSRPALNRLRELVKEKKIDAILVWKIDRLSRSLKHLLGLFEEFESHDVSFISIQENIDFKGPIGRLVFQIFGAIAQFERSLIKGRTHMGKVASAEMGNYTGSSVPYGYRPIKNPGGRGKKLEVVAEEKKWVKEIFDWYIYEGMGYGAITRKLNKLGVPKGAYSAARRKTSKWVEKNVRTILHNPIYYGIHISNRKDEEGKLLEEKDWTIVGFPPCVSEIAYLQAQSVGKGRTGGRRKFEYLLSGKLWDVMFDRPRSFSGAQRTKGGFSYRRKQFKDKEGTHHPVFEFPGKQLDAFVWGKIMEALNDPEIFVKKYLSEQYCEPKKIEKIESHLSSLRQKKANLELALDRVEEAYERGAYDEDKLNQKTIEKTQAITDCELQIQELQDELSFIGSIDLEVAKLKEASEKVKYRLGSLDLKQKKIIVSLFVDHIEMSRIPKECRKDGRVKNWNISAEVSFRFNPNKFKASSIGDRTVKSHMKAKKEASIPQIHSSGAGGQD
jgi:DNA invertase Pin-like site-specific DNA recombinase